MSGVAACLDLSGATSDPEGLARMLSVLEARGPDGSSTLTVGPAVLGCARLDTLPEDGPQPITFRGVSIAADARLDNRAELESALEVAKTAPDAVLIAAAIAKWGSSAPERLEGDFAVIAWNGRQLFAFRDRFGVRPLFFAELGRFLLLASEVTALAAHPHVNLEVDRKYFLLQLAALVPPTPLTPYRNVNRLMPGEALLSEPGKPSRRWRYYELPLTVLRTTDREAAEKTRELFDEAVTVSLRRRAGIACEVSGGMDSTSIYATARALGTTPLALSIVSDIWPTVDERSFSRQLVDQRPWKLVFAENHAPGSNRPDLPWTLDEPMQDVLFGVRTELCRSLPSDTRVVLSGHGGDGIMSGGVGAVRELARKGQLLEAYRELRIWSEERDLPFASMLKRAVRPERVPIGNLPWASKRVANEARALERAVSRDAGRRARGNLDMVNFLRSTEPGLRQQPRLPVEFRYPFLYRPLVEHALSTPAYLKVRRGQGKQVLRVAMGGRLPNAILSRTLKTSFAEAYAFGIRANWKSVDSLLREPILAELNILDGKGLRQMVGAFRDGRLSRDAELVYILADEMWLSARAKNQVPTAGSSRAYDGELVGLGGKEVNHVRST